MALYRPEEMRRDIRCPGCGKDNGSWGRFCTFCGSPLDDVREVEKDGPRETETRTAVSNSDGLLSRTPGPAYGTYPGDIDLVASAGRRLGDMYRSLTNGDEERDDLAHGQMVIIAARWILVTVGLVLALWNPAEMAELQVSILLILGLAGANFFLHSRVLAGQPVSAQVVYAASAADIAVISLVLMVGGGFDTIPYVFYFPALLAMSVAFPTRMTAMYAGATIAIYGLVSMVTASPGEASTAFTQMLMLAAVAVCGNVYWRIERDRRHRTASREATASGVKEESRTA